jgi:hypothetical protein
MPEDAPSDFFSIEMAARLTTAVFVGKAILPFLVQ